MKAKKLVVVSIFLSALFFIGSANAGLVFYQNLTVKDVRSLGSGNGTAKVAFRTDQAIQVPGGLACLDHHYVIDEADNHGAALSILLSALMSGKGIEIYVYDDQCAANGRVAVSSVRVKN